MEKRQKERGSATIILIILLVIVIIAVAIAVYFFVSYNGKQEIGSLTGDASKYYTPTEAEINRTNELAGILKNQLPQMDGSTSTIPLEAGISAKLFGTSQEVSEIGISHSNAEESFENLLAGICDIAFSTTLSDNQEREAAAKNIDLRVEPIAYESLVFVVNASNPVETLTQEQLQDIYSGKITNWSEVGGNDAEIVIYQNNENSESQKYMKEFMQGTELIKPITEFLPASNSGIIEAVATYDNSENAIGYLTYRYPAYMYGADVKFIKVDGIEPTKETMLSKEYPIINYIYAVYNTAKEETTTVDELVEWLLTYDGQTAMADAGYIPVKNIETKEAELTQYATLGTGKEQSQTKASNFYYTVDARRL